MASANVPHRPGSPNRIDPRTLKAIAHPLRIELLELLLDHGPDTASGLGRRVGENSGTTSYHLRRLADVGLIAEATDLGTGRDRHWKAVSGWTLERDVFEADATRSDARMVTGELARRNAERIQRWLDDAENWAPEWRDHAVQADKRLTLTAEQMRRLAEELLELGERFRAEEHPRGTPGTTRVIVQTNVFPIGEAESPS